MIGLTPSGSTRPPRPRPPPPPPTMPPPNPPPRPPPNPPPPNPPPPPPPPRPTHWARAPPTAPATSAAATAAIPIRPYRDRSAVMVVPPARAIRRRPSVAGLARRERMHAPSPHAPRPRNRS